MKSISVALVTGATLMLASPALAHRWPHGPHGIWWWGAPEGYYGYADRGFVDLDIEPEDAVVVLDGKKIGEADDFDGFPGYLRLRPGRHQLEVRHRGYKTLVIDVRMRAGWLYRVEDELEEGDSSQRVTRDSGRPPGGEDDDEDDDRERPRRRDEPRYRDDGDRGDDAGDDGEYEDERDDSRDDEREGRPEARAPRGPDRARGAATLAYGRGEGRVRFDVDPPDATVYVDGELRGTARQILRQGGLDLGAGEHEVVVTLDGYEDRELSVSVAEGTTSVVSVELEVAQAS